MLRCFLVGKGTSSSQAPPHTHTRAHTHTHAHVQACTRTHTHTHVLWGMLSHYVTQNTRSDWRKTIVSGLKVVFTLLVKTSISAGYRNLINRLAAMKDLW